MVSSTTKELSSKKHVLYITVLFIMYLSLLSHAAEAPFALKTYQKKEPNLPFILSFVRILFLVTLSFASTLLLPSGLAPNGRRKCPLVRCSEAPCKT